MIKDAWRPIKFSIKRKQQEIFVDRNEDCIRKQIGH